MTRTMMFAGLLIACLLTLTACGGGETTSTSTGGTGGQPTTSSDGGSTSDGSNGGAGGDTSSSGGGGTGGVGGTGSTGGTDVCTDPLLAYGPTSEYTNPIGPWTDEYGGFFAGRVEPFAVNTTCQSVIVGLAEFGTFCTIPEQLGIAAWGEPEDSPVTVPTATVQSLLTAKVLPFEDSSVHVLKFTLPTSFKAGQYPFVAFQLALNVCAAGTLPACMERRGYRYRPFAPGQGWAPLDKANPEAPAQIPNVAEELVFGLADCAPE